MRLWTVHPRYLDVRGLVALWREGLLARAVLRKQTRGYRNHPQLERFKAAPNPVASINAYLAAVLDEAVRRGYQFDGRKIRGPRAAERIVETRGQLQYEWEHLLRKLEARDPAAWASASTLVRPDPHPSFRMVAGGIRSWERTEPNGHSARSASVGGTRAARRAGR